MGYSLMARQDKEKAYQELLKIRDQPFSIQLNSDDPECKAALHWHDSQERKEVLDVVNNPSHYEGSHLEVIDIIEDFNLGFHLGNAIKYILRAGKKDDMIQDLKKAIWYLERECNKSKVNER